MPLFFCVLFPAEKDHVESNVFAASNQREGLSVERDGHEDHSDEEAGNDHEDDPAPDFSNLTGRQKRLFELRLKMVRGGSAYEWRSRLIVPFVFHFIEYLYFYFILNSILFMQNEARKANQTAMVAEKKKLEAPVESRGISKQKWLEERKKKIGKLLDANGLDMTKSYMLDTQEMAESKYKKWEKKPAPSGWDGK